MSKLFSNSFYIALDRWTFLCQCIDFCLKNEDRKKGRIQNASKHLRWKALHLRCLRQSWLYLWKNATAQKMKIFWKSAETAVWSHLLKKSFHGKLYFLQCAIPLFIFIETSGIRQLDVSWKFSFVKFQENLRKLLNGIIYWKAFFYWKIGHHVQCPTESLLCCWKPQNCIRIPIQKQLRGGVLSKKCSENMQEIYRRTSMLNCDFNKVALQLYWIHTLAWMFSCKCPAYFQNTFD